MKNTLVSMKIAMTMTALILSCLPIGAQNVNQGIRPDIPPSPQAVAFNRLGNYQVNNNYGAPDISIPLFEIDHHGYKIPLTLHYEAAPMKPGYNYDVTGLGWTLSGNSCVSRTIKDRADEVVRYNYSSPFMLDPFEDKQGHALKYGEHQNELDQMNYQYDSYNIVLPSGRTIPFFMYKRDGVMQYERLYFDRAVKISCTYSSNSIDAFTVTDEKGVEYSFREAEKASSGFDNDLNANRNVTWLLTSIYIPDKGSITYEYTDLQDINTYTIEEPVIKVSRLMSQMTADSGDRKLKVSCPPQPQCPRYRMRFLSSISYGPTKICFNYDSDKLHMKEILVSDHNDIIKKISLNITGSFLNSLVISGQDGKDRLVYGFEYWNRTPDNNSLVKHTDYWGNLCYSNTSKDLGNFNMFFNNEEDGHMYLNFNDLAVQLRNDNLAQLINNKDGDPYYYYKIKLQSAQAGDSRKPTPPEYHGVLRRITYPNGGHTDFTFENHRFPTATAADGDFVLDRRSQRIIEGGGFRIKSIKNYTADETVASEDHYRYGFTYRDIKQRNFPLPLPDAYSDEDHIGCGEAVVDPNLLTFMSFSYYSANTITKLRQFQRMVLGMESNFRRSFNIQGSATWWDATFSANTFRSLLGGRRPVVYPEITVYHGNPENLSECISKTVYKYDIYNYKHNPSTYYLSSIKQTETLDTAYFERIYYDFFSDAPELIRDDSKGAMRHQLKSQSDYSYNPANGTWNLVSEEEYSYSDESISKSEWMFNSSLSRERRTNYYDELGNNSWLEDNILSSFYVSRSQYLCRATMTKKSTTTLRSGGTRTWYNTQDESFEYLYSGILSNRKYSDQLKNEYSYSYDMEDCYSYTGYGGESDAITEMQNRNMLASMTAAETYSLDLSTVLSGSKIDYAFFGNSILPSKLYERNGEVYEESIEVLSYDSYANPTEIVDLKTGVHSVYVWGSYGRYLVAMIKNATLSQVGDVSTLLAGTSQTRHATLRAMLPSAQIQTWDYLPLIGVSSFTDANGQTICYEYDGLGRLKSEKRVANGVAEPEILHEYKYNYKNQ